MLTEPTNEKLKAMRLDAMAAAWSEQTGNPDVHNLAFDERFGMLVDAEWLHRENKRLAAALRDAKLRLSSACIEDIDYPAHRELDRAQIRQLASCRWVVEHQNVLITSAAEPISSDGGALLLRQVDRRLGLLDAMSVALPDPRDPRYVEHTLVELLRQRIYGIALGYEDCNDATTLRRDPVLKTCCDRDPFSDHHLASQPTLSRLENEAGPKRVATCLRG